MWNRSHTVPHMEIGEHSIDLFHVDLRCKAGLHDHERATLGLGKICQCVGSTTSQMICAVCEWHFIGEEAEATEAWHDHAFPGWRDLPILPDKLRGQMGTRKMTPKLEEWFEAHYLPRRISSARRTHPHDPRQVRDPPRAQLQPLRWIRPQRGKSTELTIKPGARDRGRLAPWSKYMHNGYCGYYTQCLYSLECL